MDEKFIIIHKPKFFKKIFAILLILGAMFFVNKDVFLFESNFIKGDGEDAKLYYWLSKYITQHFFENGFFQTSMLYPYGETLAWSDNFILPSIVIKFFNLFFSFDVSYNLCFFITRVLNGYTLFLLLYLFSGSFLYSALPASLFSVCSPLFFQTNSHPQLQFIFFIPLTIYYFFRFLENKRKIFSFLIGFSIFLSFLCAVYYAIFSCFIVFFLFIAIKILKSKYVDLKFFNNLLLGGILGILPILLVLFPYLEIPKALGYRNVYEPYYFAANFLSYFSSSPLNLLYNSMQKFSHPEAYLFSGIVPLIFLSLCAFTLLKKSRTLFIYVFLFCIVFLSSLFCSMFIGDNGFTELKSISSFYSRLSVISNFKYLHYTVSFGLWLSFFIMILFMRKLSYFEYKANLSVLSNKSIVVILFFLFFCMLFISFGTLGCDEVAARPTSLYYLMYKFFPGAKSIRAIGRVGLIVVMLMYILLSFNFFLISRNKKFLSFVFIILIGINLFEQKTINYKNGTTYETPILFKDDIKKLPKKSVYFYLPLTKTKEEASTFAEKVRLQTKYMLGTVDLGNTVVNGYSGQVGRNIKEHPRKMANFPDRMSVNTLSFIYNLRYVIFDGDEVENFDKEDFEKRLSEFKDELKLLKQEGNKYLIEFTGYVQNSETYFLMVPKYKKHITIQILTQDSPEGGHEGNKSVVIRNRNNRTFIAKITPKEDGVWKRYKISLVNAQIDNKVTPFRLVFSGISPNQKIFVKNRK